MSNIQPLVTPWVVFWPGHAKYHDFVGMSYVNWNPKWYITYTGDIFCNMQPCHLNQYIWLYKCLSHSSLQVGISLVIKLYIYVSQTCNTQLCLCTCYNLQWLYSFFPEYNLVFILIVAYIFSDVVYIKEHFVFEVQDIFLFSICIMMHFRDSTLLCIELGRMYNEVYINQNMAINVCPGCPSPALWWSITTSPVFGHLWNCPLPTSSWFVKPASQRYNF